ncbi:hypothetical protein C1I98_09725 [Spongiactinospora gelatinilytica]|uniref:Ornithine cyclodeaminase n=1 Tax=Spongiactinospora gelatinilytica TaxID=2666298 RepID=A0A2W2H7G9_9ACTN|nr:hypothetical protein [Spongiactinospora gelatinilytica]PZG50779.1 hypothetical protein C1I98_09725 [Spongiactinospora gelatinilytica]
MTSALWLNGDDVHDALDAFEPVAPLVEELLAGDGGQPPAATGSYRGQEVLIVEDPAMAVSFVLSRRAVHRIHRAGLTAAVARRLVGPTAATICIVGSRESATVHMTMLAKRLENVAHVAACVLGDAADRSVAPGTLDDLFMAGVSLSVGNNVNEALFGANLVVIDTAGVELRVDWASPRAVIVNTSGQDLPAAVVERAATVYVDDLRLLPEHQHRDFVRRNRTGCASSNGRPRGRPRGHRAAPDIGDLKTLLRGDRCAPPFPARFVLVELLSVGTISRRFALGIGRAALNLGLGQRIDNPRPRQHGE